MLNETLISLSLVLAQLQDNLQNRKQPIESIEEKAGMGDFPGFANLPVAFQKTIICESGGNQFTSKGKVLVSPTKDRGIMQINAPVHEKKAKSMGWNIDTTEGNLAYGYWLYQREGLYPWVCARKLGFI